MELNGAFYSFFFIPFFGFTFSGGLKVLVVHKEMMNRTKLKKIKKKIKNERVYFKGQVLLTMLIVTLLNAIKTSLSQARFRHWAKGVEARNLR